MNASKDAHNAVPVKLSDMPFYRSMKIVQDNTGHTDSQLLLNNVGFKAIPERCGCGHEWSAFDLIVDAVETEKHDWDFFKEVLAGDFVGFFHRKADLTCYCGITTERIDVIYYYPGQKAALWNYDTIPP